MGSAGLLCVRVRCCGHPAPGRARDLVPCLFSTLPCAHSPLLEGARKGRGCLFMDDMPARGFPTPQGQCISLGKGLAVPWAGEAWLTPQPCWQAQGHGAMCDHYLVGNVGPPYRNHCHPTSKKGQVASGSVGSSAVVCG